MKRFTKYFLVFFTLVLLYILYEICPISSAPKELSRLSDTTRIRKHFEVILNTSQSRNYQHVAVLDSVAEYIHSEFNKYTKRVEWQEFEVDNNKYKNVIASFGPENGERIIIGAHYDVCHEQDGADDNASGTIALLELARLFSTSELKCRIDLVAYTLEEPPYFRTEYMGSAVHAKSLYDNNIPVKGMICMEMIGYYSEQENSQSYPMDFLEWFYGSKGNYITVVQKYMNGSFSENFKKAMFENNSILTKSFKGTSFIPGVDFSDHLNYWHYGYSAVMITNTAFYRNKNYHTSDDILSTINIPNMALVIDGTYRSVLDLTKNGSKQ